MSRFAQMQKKFDALQPRERTLFSVTAGVLLLAAIYMLWIEPTEKALAINEEQLGSVEPQVEGSRGALQRLQAELARDPEDARRLALAQLNEEAKAIDGRLRNEQAGVIPPGSMPGVLRDLLGRDSRLTVISVEALPPEVTRWIPAAAAPPAEDADPNATQEAQDQAAAAAIDVVPALYRHRVVLRFDGDFSSALTYVRAVEALPFRVRMNAFHLDAEKWPQLRITLEVETLGLEEGWIGV